MPVPQAKAMVNSMQMTKRIQPREALIYTR